MSITERLHQGEYMCQDTVDAYDYIYKYLYKIIIINNNGSYLCLLRFQVVFILFLILLSILFFINLLLYVYSII